MRTALGFFWKVGWAFMLGYAVSAMIQVFVPKTRLTRYPGDPGTHSVALATLLNANGVQFAGIMGFNYSGSHGAAAGGHQRQVLRLARGLVHRGDFANLVRCRSDRGSTPFWVPLTDFAQDGPTCRARSAPCQTGRKRPWP